MQLVLNQCLLFCMFCIYVDEIRASDFSSDTLSDKNDQSGFVLRHDQPIDLVAEQGKDISKHEDVSCSTRLQDCKIPQKRSKREPKHFTFSDEDLLKDQKREEAKIVRLWLEEHCTMS